MRTYIERTRRASNPGTSNADLSHLDTYKVSRTQDTKTCWEVKHMAAYEYLTLLVPRY